MQSGIEVTRWLIVRKGPLWVASRQSEANAVRNQMPHNKWLQGTRETAASCFAGVISARP